MSRTRSVASVASLLDAVQRRCEVIEVVGTIWGPPRLTLAPGTTLTGGTLCFGGKGIRLTCDNVLDDIAVVTPVDEVAIYNDTTVSDFGTLWLRRVRTIGQVAFLVDGPLRSGHLRVDGLQVTEADVRGRSERPSHDGVEAIQGAFTLWNRHLDPTAVITAELLDLGAGTVEHPIRGCGVLVSGRVGGGSVRVKRLRTNEIHADGHIPPTTPDLVGGGVLMLAGTHADHVALAGPVAAYGHNDRPFDTWGEVTRLDGPAAPTIPSVPMARTQPWVPVPDPVMPIPGPASVPDTSAVPLPDTVASLAANGSRIPPTCPDPTDSDVILDY